MVLKKNSPTFPSNDNNSLLKSPLFFGWYVVMCSFIILFFTMGARTIIGVMFNPLGAEFDWPRTYISLAVLINMTVFALTLTLVGRMYDRHGARGIVIAASLLMGAGYLGLALIMTDLWHLLLFYGVLTAIGFGGASVPLFAAITGKWFQQKRGVAISLALAGACLGQYALVPAASHVVFTYGWRTAFAATGIILVTVNVTLAIPFLKGEPRDLGIRPYGSNLQGLAHGPIIGMRLAEAMRTRSFWLYFMIMCVCGGGDYFFLTHLIPMVTDQGITTATAARMLGLMGLFSFFGILSTGPAADRYGNKIPLILTFALRMVMLGLIVLVKREWSFYVFAAVFGFTLLITAPLTTTLLGRLYGFEHIGLISGVVTTAHHLSGGLLAYIGGVWFETAQSYQAVLFFYGAACAGAVICSVFILDQSHLDKN